MAGADVVERHWNRKDVKAQHPLLRSIHLGQVSDKYSAHALLIKECGPMVVGVIRPLKSMRQSYLAPPERNTHLQD